MGKPKRLYRAKHEKFLRSVKYTGNGKAYKVPFPDLSVENECPPTSDRIVAGSTARKEKPILKQYVIGQAYHKGGFQVLSKKEAADPKTGKRRQ
jgi:hypothetical protein